MIAGELRPKLRLKPHVFAGDDSPGFRQQVMRIGRAGLQLLRIVGQDREGQVMLAHHELARHQVVAGVAQPVRLGHGGVIRVAQPSFLEGHLAHGLVLRGAAEGLGQDEAEGGRQQVVEHVRARAGVIFLDAEHRAIGAGGGMADFQRLPPEDHPVGVDRIADGPVNQRDRLIPARDQLLQDTGRLGDQQVAVVPDDRELPRPKAAEAAGQLRGFVVEIVQKILVHLDLAGAGTTDAPCQPTAGQAAGLHVDGKIQIVAEEAFGLDAAAVAFVDPAGEVGDKGAGRIVVICGPDHMDIGHDGIVGDVAQGMAELVVQRVDELGIRRAERDAFQLHHLEGPPVARDDRVSVRMADEGKVAVCRVLRLDLVEQAHQSISSIL